MLLVGVELIVILQTCTQRDTKPKAVFSSFQNWLAQPPPTPTPPYVFNSLWHEVKGMLEFNTNVMIYIISTCPSVSKNKEDEMHKCTEMHKLMSMYAQYKHMNTQSSATFCLRQAPHRGITYLNAYLEVHPAKTVVSPLKGCFRQLYILYNTFLFIYCMQELIDLHLHPVLFVFRNEGQSYFLW